MSKVVFSVFTEKTSEPPKGAGKLVPRKKLSKSVENIFDTFWRFLTCFRSRPGKPNQRKGQHEKFMNFTHFCEFWCFSLGKQARFTLNFCSGMPLRKVHELTFLWFGLPGPLLSFVPCAKIVEKCRKTFWHFLMFFDVAPFRPLLQSVEKNCFVAFPPPKKKSAPHACV